MNKDKIDTTKAVVIYHANCVDGFASAWAFHTLKEKDYTEGVWYVPCNYGEIPEQKKFPGEPCDVYILDFSFPRNVIESLAEKNKNILILDHHKTAKEIFDNWVNHPDNVCWIFDMERSGCGITWDYFGGKNNLRPRLINYIEDRDLWKFDLDESKKINARIGLEEFTFEAYDNLNKAKIYMLIIEGHILERQHKKTCNEIVKEAREVIIHDALNSEEGTHWGLACNCTPQFSSEVGQLLALNSHTFGATYFSLASGEVQWSLRSNGEYDVSAIAKQFGGGGHRNAAGFRVMLGESINPEIIHLWGFKEKEI